MRLGANDLKIQISDTPDEAPTYRLPEYKAANLTTAQIVGHGTTHGNPTVDFIFEDQDGQKYVAMLTAGLVESLDAAIQGFKARTQ